MTPNNRKVIRESTSRDSKEIVEQFHTAFAEFNKLPAKNIAANLMVVGVNAEIKGNKGVQFSITMGGPPPILAVAVMDVVKTLIDEDPVAALFFVLGVTKHMAEITAKREQGLTDKQLDAHEETLEKLLGNAISPELRELLDKTMKFNGQN